MLFIKTKKGRGRPPKAKKDYRFRLIIGILLTAIGVIALFSNLSEPEKKVENSKNTAIQEKKGSESAVPSKNEPIKIEASLLSAREKSQPPEKIIIPEVEIDLSVKEARVINGYWELSENTASHGQGSAYPGEKGNVVIFAHARKGLFYNLKNIKSNESIYLLTKDRWYKYKVTDIKTVFPNQVETIAQTDDETLTLYTCSGFLDEKRLIVKAKPER